jgi:hypothetical protein
MTNAVNLASAAGTGFAFRNRIINGDMRIWQRGTSATSTAAGVYLADRFLAFANGANGTVSQFTGPSGFPISLRQQGGAGNTELIFQQRIESQNCQDLNSTTVTLSFWVYQSTGASLSSAFVQLLRPNAADNYTATTQLGSNYTIPAIPNATWTFVSCSFPTDASTTNGIVVQWRSGVGFGASQSFAITGVQLEVGSVVTPFERRPYGLELSLCQRYAEPISGVVIAINSIYKDFYYKVQKRAAPTLSNIVIDGGSGATFTTTIDSVTRCYQETANSTPANFRAFVNAEL